jgi:hypothetical protein
VIMRMDLIGVITRELEIPEAPKLIECTASPGGEVMTAGTGHELRPTLVCSAHIKPPATTGMVVGACS